MASIALDRVPLPVFFAITVLVVLGAVTVGFRAGLRRRRKAAAESDAPIGSVVGAMLGLLAFILAFTFGMAASRFDQRKQLLLSEVNAIGTASLRADLLAEPDRSACRELLKQYVDVRVGIANRPNELAHAIAESEAIQDRLWSHAIAIAGRAPESHVTSLFIQSLNEVFDFHTARVTVGLQYRIPINIWLGLFFVTTLSMASVGYQFGLCGRGGLLIRTFLALTFASVVVLIADLDRATQGTLKVSQQPMIDLQQKLGEARVP